MSKWQIITVTNDPSIVTVEAEELDILEQIAYFYDKDQEIIHSAPADKVVIVKLEG